MMQRFNLSGNPAHDGEWDADSLDQLRKLRVIQGTEEGREGEDQLNGCSVDIELISEFTISVTSLSVRTRSIRVIAQDFMSEEAARVSYAMLLEIVDAMFSKTLVPDGVDRSNRAVYVRFRDKISNVGMVFLGEFFFANDALSAKNLADGLIEIVGSHDFARVEFKGRTDRT